MSSIENFITLASVSDNKIPVLDITNSHLKGEILPKGSLALDRDTKHLYFSTGSEWEEIQGEGGNKIQVFKVISTNNMINGKSGTYFFDSSKNSFDIIISESNMVSESINNKIFSLLFKTEDDVTELVMMKPC